MRLEEVFKILLKKFVSIEIMPIFAIQSSDKIRGFNAEIAQLVEHHLAKVGVASSSLVFRSNEDSRKVVLFCLHHRIPRTPETAPEDKTITSLPDEIFTRCLIIFSGP